MLWDLILSLTPIFFLWIFISNGSALKYSIQIVAPERSSTETNLRSAIYRASSVVNGGRVNAIRSSGHSVEADIVYIDNEYPMPAQFTKLFCEGVFLHNASIVMVINYNQLTSKATEYIVSVSQFLGLPVISWDPFFPGALEVRHLL